MQSRVLLTFRASITCAVLAFIFVLAALLIAIQVRSLYLATREAVSASMDASNATVVGRLRTEITAVASVVNILASSSSVSQSADPTEVSAAIPLFKTALAELPQLDSVYVGFHDGAWLQVRGFKTLTDEQRQRLGANADAAVVINLIRPTGDGELPLRRIFADQEGNKIEQLDLWRYGYDARSRGWYQDTLKARHLLISAPYIAFSIGAPVITISTPLRGTAEGVLAADIKLDSFSDFVETQKPGPHGTAIMFDATGALIAHPDFAKFVERSLTHPREPKLPNINEVSSRVMAAALRVGQAHGRNDKYIRGDDGRDYIFRLVTFDLGEISRVTLLLLAAPGDFGQEFRKLQLTGLILAVLAWIAFVPAVWIFGGRMSRSIRHITAQAATLQTLAAPDPKPVTSRIKELHELGSTVGLAQQAIWSFARFVPKEIAQRVIDNSISTELGGVREEITVLFTDVQDFTAIAEVADPDSLMHQTSRYFSTLTDVFLAEGGTVDKFIGDAVMVIWNAPNPQPDHVERACRAALAAKAASERLNLQFEAEGLRPFVTRFGVHVGEAVVGNLGSTERMNYTALGNTVNLASRLEGLNKQLGTSILVSESVFSRAQGRFRFRAFEAVAVKGINRKTAVLELIAAVSEAVEERGGRLRVAGTGRPPAEGEIGGESEGGPLVEAAGKMVEKLSARSRKRQISEFVEGDEAPTDKVVVDPS